MLTRGQSKAKCLPLARQGHYIGNQCKVCPIWCCGKRLWCHRWRNALTTSIRVTQQLSCMTENLPYVIQKSTNLSLLWICLVLSLWEDDCLGLIRYSQLVPSRFKQGERPSPRGLTPLYTTSLKRGSFAIKIQSHIVTHWHAVDWNTEIAAAAAAEACSCLLLVCLSARMQFMMGT